MTHADGVCKLQVRIPQDLKKWLEDRARYEAAAQNTLVVQALRRLQEATANA